MTTGTNADGPVHLNISHQEDTCLVHLTVVCNSCYDAMLVADGIKRKVLSGLDFEIKFAAQVPAPKEPPK